MKVLILSITAGEGHNSTAKAIKAQFDSMPNTECRILDTYEYLNKLLAVTISEGYLLSTSMVPKPYSKFYRLAEKRTKTGEDMSAMRLSHNVMAKKLKKYTDVYKPDVVICTHIFAAAIVDVMKVKYKSEFTAVGIVTDFKFHPFWEEGIHLDYIVTANELMNIQAFKKGYKKSQILPFGIPIKPQFAQRENQQAVRRRYGLDPGKFTLLLMSGSMGYGNIEKTVKQLDEIKVDFQTIVVCGNNKQAKEALDEMEFTKSFTILGYVDYVDKLMDAADCIITKPGGLTSSEALAKGLPMIVVNPIPGQEDRNTEFLLNNGVAMYVTDTCPLDEVIYQFFYFRDKIANMKKNIALIGKPNSTKTICEFLYNNYNKN
ncbi:MAG: glycosyltransferase [Ruminococcaceae bacterium]|nr:glycosyltransferase [Oscillospiraceae bacterium]